MSEHGWTHALPIFRVRDLAASLAYYRDKLGFKEDWSTPGIASVSREECTIFLCEVDQTAATTWAWIGVNDAEKVHDELRAKGAVIRNPPTNYYWALEMQVSDPDGNVLRIGSEPREGEPEGEFLDASGKRWPTNADGERTADDAR